MDKREFLKLSGMMGIASLLPVSKMYSRPPIADGNGGCTLTPTEVAGPFPLDLSENATFFRQDVRETQAGVQLNLKMRIMTVNDCQPLSNVRVNIWHCNNEGLYSGYSLPNNPGQAGLTYLRGYQMTDANGEVDFITILPGWYPGRVCHIHFQVYVDSNHAAISQLTFDAQTKNDIYLANPSLYPDGVDPIEILDDGIFSDGAGNQLASLYISETSEGYNSYLPVFIEGSGTVGLGYLDRENNKQFQLGQNFPNPYDTETTIPFSLVQSSDVKLDIYDLSGRRLYSKTKQGLNAGAHQWTLNMPSLGLATANYIYQIEVKNSQGEFRTYKMMTAAK